MIDHRRLVALCAGLILVAVLLGWSHANANAAGPPQCRDGSRLADVAVLLSPALDEGSVIDLQNRVLDMRLPGTRGFSWATSAMNVYGYGDRPMGAQDRKRIRKKLDGTTGVEAVKFGIEAERPSFVPGGEC